MPYGFNVNRSGMMGGFGFGNANSVTPPVVPDLREIIYVRKDGNDTTGDGTTATPYLTVEKALSEVPAGGDMRILVGAGTYQMTDGSHDYFPIAYAFAAKTTIESESGVATDVILQGPQDTPAGLTEFKVTGHTTNLEFKLLTMKDRAPSLFFGHATGTGATITNLWWTQCIWDMGATCSINFRLAGYAGTLSGLKWDRCTLNSAKQDCNGYEVLSGGGTISGIEIIDCTGTLAGGWFRFDGASDCTVARNTMTCNANTAGSRIAALFGSANATAGGLSGTGNVFEDNVVTCAAAAGYAHTIGVGAGHVAIVQRNTVTKGDIFVKVNTGSQVLNNTMIESRGVELKAANACIVRGNDISVLGTPNACIAVPADGDVGNSENCEIDNNSLRATSTGGRCYAIVGDNWPDLDTSNSVDYNDIYQTGGGVAGDILGYTGLTLKAQLVAAWQDASCPGPSANSNNDVVH